MDAGLQLYSLREQLAEDAAAIISAIGKLGFTDAEGYDLIHLKSILPLLENEGITVRSSFLLWSHITGRHDLAQQIGYPWMPAHWGIDHEIELAHALGLKRLVCGYLLPEERSSFDDFKRLAEQLNKAGEACHAAGIGLLYHNHTFEFFEQEGQTPYTYLQDNTSPDYVGFELDVLWVQFAGWSPIDVMAALGNRLKALHLKSGAAEYLPLRDEKTLPLSGHDHPLGAGNVDIPPILDAIRDRQDVHLYIEQEYGRDLIKSLGVSLNFVRSYSS